MFHHIIRIISFHLAKFSYFISQSSVSLFFQLSFVSGNTPHISLDFHGKSLDFHVEIKSRLMTVMFYLRTRQLSSHTNFLVLSFTLVNVFCASICCSCFCCKESLNGPKFWVGRFLGNMATNLYGISICSNRLLTYTGRRSSILLHPSGTFPSRSLESNIKVLVRGLLVFFHLKKLPSFAFEIH